MAGGEFAHLPLPFAVLLILLAFPAIIFKLRFCLIRKESLVLLFFLMIFFFLRVFSFVFKSFFFISSFCSNQFPFLWVPLHFLFLPFSLSYSFSFVFGILHVDLLLVIFCFLWLLQSSFVFFIGFTKKINQASQK